MVGKRWAWIGIIGLVVLFLASTTTGAANRDFRKISTVKMGILAPVQMPVGQGIMNAAKLAADEINAAGGILGKKLSWSSATRNRNPKRVS